MELEITRKVWKIGKSHVVTIPHHFIEAGLVPTDRKVSITVKVEEVKSELFGFLSHKIIEVEA